jgi:hypothetical protein
MAYNGYYIKIGGVKFNNPSPKKDTFKFAPELVQEGDSKVLASGNLSMKVLPHTRRKIWFELPPLTPEQFRIYWNALHSDVASGGRGMYLTVEVYDRTTESYITDTFYHNDLQYQEAIFGGQHMIVMDEIHLISH